MTTSPATQRRWVLAALMAAMMLAAMDATIVSTVIPQIVEELGGFSLFAWVFSIYVLAQTVMIPVYGKLADQYGRKPVLFGGTLLFLAGSVACAAAWDMTSLIAFRGLQGLGAGSIMATVNTLAGDLYHDIRERSRVQGWLSTVWGFSALAGPVMGGVFAEYVSWRWIFLINLPVGALALVLLGLFLHEKVEQRVHRIDYAGAAAIMLAVATLVFGVLQGGNAWAWLSWQSGALAVLFAVFALLAAVIERHAAEPILPGWLWRRPTLAGSNLAMVMMGIIMMGPIVYLPTFAQTVHGLGIIAAGFVLAVTSIGWPIASAASGGLSEKLGFRDAALAGATLLLLASLGFLWIPADAGILWVVADQFCLGLGYGFLSTPLLVGSQSVVGWGERGVVTGGNMFARFLGQTLGAAIMGALFNHALRAQLAEAPAAVTTLLPQGVDKLVEQLQQGVLAADVAGFLRTALFQATGALYIGMAVLAVLAALCVLIAPRRFPVQSGGD